MALQLADARRAASEFLRERRRLTPQPTQAHLDLAIDHASNATRLLYEALDEQDLFQPPWLGGRSQDWTPDKREAELAVIDATRTADKKLIAELQAVVDMSEHEPGHCRPACRGPPTPAWCCSPPRSS